MKIETWPHSPDLTPDFILEHNLTALMEDAYRTGLVPSEDQVRLLISAFCPDLYLDTFMENLYPMLEKMKARGKADRLGLSTDVHTIGGNRPDGLKASRKEKAP